VYTVGQLVSCLQQNR